MVSDPCSLIIFLEAVVVLLTSGVIVVVVLFLIDYGIWEPCVERPILYDVLKHRREVKGAWVELGLLGFLEEILDS